MKKNFLKITGILVLLMALVGFWGYNKYFAPDPEVEQQLNNQFGADFFTFDDEEMINNSEAVKKDLSVDDIAEKTDSPMIVTMPDKVNEQEKGTTSTPVNETIIENRITQDDISNKYKPQFAHLQSVALSRLDTLSSAAIQEYVQSSKGGTLSRSELLQKYIQAGIMLEASVDNQFYSTLNAMQAELVANNLPTDIVGITKRDYENAKSSKRSQLMAKALK